jgi:F-type H+-transporting ATPase subunit beta
MDAEDTGNQISVPVGPEVLGGLFDVVGNSLSDSKKEVFKALAHSQSLAKLRRPGHKTEVFQTGIKVVDLIAPFIKVEKSGFFGGAGVGKTVFLQELIRMCRGIGRSFCVCRRWRENREGNDLHRE